MDPEQRAYCYLQCSSSGVEDVVYIHWKLYLNSRAIQASRRAIQCHVPSQSLLGISFPIAVSDHSIGTLVKVWMRWSSPKPRATCTISYTSRQSNSNNRLLNTNNTKTPLLTKRRNTMRKLLSRKVLSKSCHPRSGSTQQDKRFLLSISVLFLFSNFISFVVCGDRGACVLDLSFISSVCLLYRRFNTSFHQKHLTPSIALV